MIFCIITHIEHIEKDSHLFGYAPYIKEMNIWNQNATKVLIVAPLSNSQLNPIFAPYKKNDIIFYNVPSVSLISFKAVFNTLLVIPKIILVIYQAMKQADHIHLRCPGNMGLLGAMVQILFPKKKKTAKYAGNWDPKSKQPLSYKLQKWILSNTFLTRNMQVLVYGEWKNQSKNIKPFFTATYADADKIAIKPRKVNENTILKFLFVGTLSKGKQPLYAVKLVELLIAKGYKAQLEILGEGPERLTLHDYIAFKALKDYIYLLGNQSAEFTQQKYQESHFLILPSKSEGWPKVVAEAMFWGCLPIATPVSCVPYMLDYGKRGVLLSKNLLEDFEKIILLLQNKNRFEDKIIKAISWSQTYTTNFFENEILKILKYD